MSEHTCHAVGCERHCKPEYLMCAKHWRLVPPRLRAAVYAYYRPGQCDDKQPSLKWIEAAKDAIKAVAEREGKTTSMTQLRLL